MKKFFKLIRKYLLAGVLTIIPLYATFVLLRLVVGFIDDHVLPLIPEPYYRDIPGLGVVILLLLLLLTGFLVSNRLGIAIINLLDQQLRRIPMAGDLYSNIKTVLKKFTNRDEEGNFSAAVLIEYPTKGLWTIGFITNNATGELQKKLGKGTLTVFIPLVPIPTQGILLLVDDKKVKRLHMKVQDALSYMMSLGATQESEELSTSHYQMDKTMVKKMLKKDKNTHRG